jgi:hypothetical protein
MDMLRKPVVAASETGGYVLDGFPRPYKRRRSRWPSHRGRGAAAVHPMSPPLSWWLTVPGRGSTTPKP